MSCYHEGDCRCAEHIIKLIEVIETEAGMALGDAAMWAMEHITNGLTQKILLIKIKGELSTLLTMKGATDKQIEEIGIPQLLEDIREALGEKE